MSAVPRPGFRIRPLTVADLDAVDAIERSIYEFPWTLGNFRDSIAAGYSCWALHGADGLMGYAVMMLGAGEAHLLNLSIAAPCQRRGLASRLLEHLISAARDYGARLMFLEVRPSNDGARRLYAGYGFRQVGTRRGYYPAREGREDALVLSLAL
jgi:ribosomal-protein-alanine N-acetyltransferase